MKNSPSHDHITVPDETTRRGALVLRTLPILLIPILVTAITFALLRMSLGDQIEPTGDRGGPPGGPLIPIVVLVVFFSALIILVRLGRPTISALIVIATWTLVTTAGALQSGVTSSFPALLIIPICVAGLLIDGVASMSLAALGALLVTSVAWLEKNGLTPTHRTPPRAIAENEAYFAAGFWIAIFATVAALTWLLAGSLQRALQQSRAQALALQELSNQLEARVEQQTARLLDQEREAATLEERARLAREIHDTLAQGLTGIVVQLGAAQRALAAKAEAADQHIELAQQMARESLAEARRSVWNLRAPALKRGDLSDALRGLASRPPKPETTASFEQRGEPWPLPPGVESALLRVGQEALVNVAKHAGATHAQVTLEYTPEAVRLSISDDGVGFADLSPAPDVAAPGPWGGFGLLGMRERLAALGGSLELFNNGGAHVVAVVPREDKKIGRPGDKQMRLQ
ncbi:MAG TPA: sensor histidine kinase [Roseiflexaceae bacterium]|nr:sensor histidine kinase [Roseiflexaceae bacterium]